MVINESVIPSKAGAIFILVSYTEESIYRNPAFHFNTDDIHKAYTFLKERNVEFVTKIENGHWFNFEDPDGNILMVSHC